MASHTTGTTVKRSRKTIVGSVVATVGVALLSGAPVTFAQTDRIYFPAVENVTSVLVGAIGAETERIDMSAWYLTDRRISLALVDAFHRGVNVRLIGDRGSIFEIDLKTQTEFYWLASQGIPIRLRYQPTWFPEIQHWKATIFKGQRLVAFGSANYTPFQLAPHSATDYSDETVLFSTDAALVNAFLTRFDVIWNDAMREPGSQIGPPYLRNWSEACASESACGDYRTLYPNPAPMSISTARLEPDHPTPPDLIWSQGQAFNARLIEEIQSESSLVRFVIYRLTASNVADALLARFQAGVPVQLIVEPSEYLNRKWPEFWLTHAHIDRLWAAGVPIRQRRHQGLTHMKMLVTSRYATNASSNIADNWQRDTNYFVSASEKPGVYQAMSGRFDTMWNDTAGFSDFVPGLPDSPVLLSPTVAARVSQAPTLTWRAAPFATSYHVYLGTTPDSMPPVGSVPADLTSAPPDSYSWTSPMPLSGGTTYYWKVVARTNATVRDPSLMASSTTQSFLTSGSTPPVAASLVNPLDFAGDGRARPVVFRRPLGEWYLLGTGGMVFGQQGDVPVPGDYDGDGRSDVAVWRPSTGTWWILRSSTRTSFTVQWGNPGSDDRPYPADYDGDGRTDLAVWRPSTATWWILGSRDGYSYRTRLMIQWGIPGGDDEPVPGDYDGDGRADIAVWRPETGVWWILRSTDALASALQWGNPSSNDIPVPADYDGDGRTDIAVWRPEGGVWWILRSRDSYSYATRWLYQWGVDTEGDVPLPGDFDGDGRADLVVWRPGLSYWFVRKSSGGYNTYWNAQYGSQAAGDVPVTVSQPALRRYLAR